MAKAMALALLLIVVVGFLPQVSHAQVNQPPGDLYLALGDSLTQGYEVINDHAPGYPALIWSDIQAMNTRSDQLPEGLEYDILGVVGETSSTMRRGQLAAATNYIDFANQSQKCVGLITLSIGGNDFGQILTGEVTANQAIPLLQTNLEYILSTIRSKIESQRLNPLLRECRTKLVLMDYYNPYPALAIPPNNLPLADMYLPKLNQIIHDTALTQGWSVVHVEDAFRGREAELIYVNQDIYTNPLLRIPFGPWFAANVDFHPRPAGHRLIADLFLQQIQAVPEVWSMEKLPDRFLPNVALNSPWACGECTGHQQAALLALPEPQTINLEWLGAQLWNRVSRPILCWLLAMFQVGLNVYAYALNALWLPALNTFFRLIYSGMQWFIAAYQHGYFLAEDLRYQLWSINLQLERQALATVAGATATGAELDSMLSAWLAVFSGALAPWTYFVGMYVQTANQITDVLVHVGDHRPDPLVAIEHFWLFAALKGVLRGFYESQLGWWLTAQIGLFALGTGLYILDEAAEM